MDSADSTPLECAGATVYAALADLIKPYIRVGIVGIGGLGQLAIQYASKMGADVVICSTSRDNEVEARALEREGFPL